MKPLGAGLLIFLLVMTFSFVNPGQAQTDDDALCSALVEDALHEIEIHCIDTGRNQVCYGHSLIMAELTQGAKFDTLGDIIPVADVEHLALQPMDTAASEWGVVLMQLQANLPDTLPGQNVTILMIGEVELTPAEDTGSALNAFYLKTGIGDSQCEQAPDSGILIQTPRGIGKVQLTVNDVEIELGSTAYLQAEPDMGMAISVLEGEGAARIPQANGHPPIDQPIPQGTTLTIPLDADLHATGDPGQLSAYQTETQTKLTAPVDVLPEDIEITNPPRISVITPDCPASSLTTDDLYFYQASYGFIPNNPTPPNHEIGLSPEAIFDGVSFTARLNIGALAAPVSNKYTHEGGGQRHVQQMFYIGFLEAGEYTMTQTWSLGATSGTNSCTFTVTAP